MNTLRLLLIAATPPALWMLGSAINRRRRRSVDHYEYAPRGWNTPLPDGQTSEGYWTAFIARERLAVEQLIARVKAGRPEPLTGERFKHLAYGYVIALAASLQRRIAVLDYGGNLGDYFWLARKMVPDTPLDYHCRELPAIAAAGREVTPDVTWHVDDACLDRQYDLVMFSSSLQYLPEWQRQLRLAAAATRHYLFLSDVPTVRDVPTYMATERSGGVTNLHYQLNETEILQTVEAAGLRIVREFAMGAYPLVAQAPEQPTCKGWLFRRPASDAL